MNVFCVLLAGVAFSGDRALSLQDERALDMEGSETHTDHESA